MDLEVKIESIYHFFISQKVTCNHEYVDENMADNRVTVFHGLRALSTYDLCLFPLKSVKSFLVSEGALYAVKHGI